MHYDPKNWFWIVGGDETRAWSSAAGAFVAVWPVDSVTRIASESELGDVLRPHGIIGPAVRRDDVKLETRRRILARFPEWKQTNMLARGLELQEIWRQSGVWNMEEQAEANALDAAWAWIKSVRAASDLLELMSPIPRDFNNDRHWPE